MREKQYTYKKKVKYKNYNSYEGDVGGVKPNILNQNFSITKPYQKAGTDITMFRVNEEEAIYLSPIIDFDSREVLSYVVAKDATVKRVTKMLELLKENHKEKIKNMIIQSDQGVQYQNSRYSDMLENLNIIQSMSRKGNCLDNSPTENFFGRLKNEIWYNKEKEYKNGNDLINTIHEYIKYYNETRIVTKLGCSPIDYRNKKLV